MDKKDDIFEGRSVPAAILKFAVPTILSQLVTLLYNLADTFFVGHTNEPSQVAALALSFPIFMLLNMIGNLFGIGANSMISRSLGMGKKAVARKTSTFAFYGAILSTLIMVALLGIFIEPILTAIGARDHATFAATNAYLKWTVICGGVPTVAALMLGHLIRAVGNTRQASIGMSLGGLLNIVLDALFVQWLEMGAEGAGIATMISNAVSFLYLLIVIVRGRDGVIVLNFRRLTLVPYIMKGVILVGVPASAIIVLGSAANMVLTHCMSGYGDVSVAAYGVVQKIGTVAIQITVGLTQGIMPLLGFCYGSGNIARVRSLNRWSFGIIAVYSTACIVLTELFSKELMFIFIADQETIETGIGFMRRWILCALGMCFTMLYNSIFQAMGKWLESLILSVMRQGFLLIPLLIVLDHYFGALGLVWSQPIADTVSLMIGTVLYLIIMGKHENKSKTKDF